MSRRELSRLYARATGAPPFEVPKTWRRPAVFVQPKPRHVETPAWKLEVVRIAAERRDRLLGRKRDSHIGVALVLVKPVLPALIQRHRLALQRRPGLLRFGLARRLQIREGLVTPSRDVCGSGTSERAGHPGGDVLGAHQHRGLLALATNFVLACLCHEAGPDEIALRGGVLSQATACAVMVGEHEAVGRHERSRAAALDSHDRVLQAIHHLIGDVDLVLLPTS
jgi:hypothetical protein